MRSSGGNQRSASSEYVQMTMAEAPPMSAVESVVSARLPPSMAAYRTQAPITLRHTPTSDAA